MKLKSRLQQCGSDSSAINEDQFNIQIIWHQIHLALVTYSWFFLYILSKRNL